MCVLAIAWRVHAEWPFVVIANRDEFYDRPTVPAARWPDRPDIIAGIDARAGGTWIGVSEHGRLAAVTNIRGEGISPSARSRGALTRAFLKGNAETEDFAAAFLATLGQYGPCNLLCFDRRTGVHLTNRPQTRMTVLEPGFHLVSNGPLAVPWPKALSLGRALETWLEDGADAGFETLFGALRSTEAPPDEDLPDTGLDIERERQLASPFVLAGEYGTRSSTVIAVRQDGNGMFEEREFDRFGRVSGTSVHAFEWPVGSSSSA